MSENKEIKIIYSDRDLLVCVKPAGVPCESANENTESAFAATHKLANLACVDGVVYRFGPVCAAIDTFISDFGKVSDELILVFVACVIRTESDFCNHNSFSFLLRSSSRSA